MATLQRQNTSISQRIFLPVQQIVSENTQQNAFGETTELGFKMPKAQHSDNQISPALDFTSFNGTAGLKHPVSNMEIKDYYLVNPAFSNDQLSENCIPSHSSKHDYVSSSINYPGMMCKGTNFMKQSDMIVSSALRTPTQSRILTNADIKTNQRSQNQGSIQYPDEIRNNGMISVWDNTNRIKKSCVTDKSHFPIFDVPVPELLENNRMDHSMVNSRDVMRHYSASQNDGVF